MSIDLPSDNTMITSFAMRSHGLARVFGATVTITTQPNVHHPLALEVTIVNVTTAAHVSSLLNLGAASSVGPSASPTAFSYSYPHGSIKKEGETGTTASSTSSALSLASLSNALPAEQLQAIREKLTAVLTRTGSVPAVLVALANAITADI